MVSKGAARAPRGRQPAASRIRFGRSVRPPTPTITATKLSPAGRSRFSTSLMSVSTRRSRRRGRHAPRPSTVSSCRRYGQRTAQLVIHEAFLGAAGRRLPDWRDSRARRRWRAGMLSRGDAADLSSVLAACSPNPAAVLCATGHTGGSLVDRGRPSGMRRELYRGPRRWLDEADADAAARGLANRADFRSRRHAAAASRSSRRGRPIRRHHRRRQRSAENAAIGERRSIADSIVMSGQHRGFRGDERGHPQASRGRDCVCSSKATVTCRPTAWSGLERCRTHSVRE